MSIHTHENWTQQLNEWNGIDPSDTSFGEHFDLSETPPVVAEAQVALGASEQILSWRAEEESPPDNFLG